MNFDADGPAGCGPIASCQYVETDPLIQCHLPLSGTRPVVSTNESPACISRRGQSHETDRCAATPCILTCASETWRDPLTPLEGWFRVSVEGDLCALWPSVTWDFGDGTQGWDTVVSHTYNASGSYDWKVTVTWDGRSWSSEGTLTVGP